MANENPANLANSITTPADATTKSVSITGNASALQPTNNANAANGNNANAANGNNVNAANGNNANAANGNNVNAANGNNANAANGNNANAANGNNGNNANAANGNRNGNVANASLNKKTKKNKNKNKQMPNQMPNQTMKQSLNQLNEESTDGDESITENTVLAPSEISTISANAIENKQIDKNTMLSLNKLTINLLNYQVVLKLYHFQTELYGSHKTIDSYLDKYAQTMDKFLEIAQGIYGKITIKKYKFNGSSHTDENIIKQLDGMIYLLRTKINNILGTYTDLINVRDELVGDIEQLKYLLRFK